LRICVYGAGAVGGTIAARLAAGGHDVAVVARGEHLAAIRARGLELQADDDSPPVLARVQASDRPADLGPQEAVLVTLKATALPQLAATIGPLLSPDTMVVFLQNGLPWWYDIGLPARLPPPPDLSLLDPGGRLRAVVGGQRTLAGVTYPSCEAIAPGVVRALRVGRQDVLVGELDDSASPRVTALRAALVQAGIPSPPVADLRHVVWNKLLVNASVSTLCALAGHPMNILDRDPALRATAQRGFREVVAIARAHGMAFADDGAALFGPQQRFSGHKPSILQDRERGRPMEIDALLLAPLAFAASAGLAAPTLATIAALLARLAVDAGSRPAP